MKGKIVCLLAVNLIFIWSGANGSDLFDDVAHDLMEKRVQRFEARKKGEDQYEVFKTNAEAYAEKFKHFLQNYHSGDRTISEKFQHVNQFAWEGHYLYKVFLNDSLRKQISFHGTPFQNELSNIIDSDNKFIIRNIKADFFDWTNSMLIHSENTPDPKIDEIRFRYTEALLALEDTTAPDFKELEVFLVFFYQMLKRLKGAEVIHQDRFILRGNTNLVNKHFNGAGFNGEEVIPICCCTESGFSKHVKAKLKLIEQKMHGKWSFRESNYEEVSKELINLYYTVFEKAPVNFDAKKFKEQFDDYFAIYFSTKSRDINFRIIQIGEVMLYSIFHENPSFFKLKTYPPA